MKQTILIVSLLLSVFLNGVLLTYVYMGNSKYVEEEYHLLPEEPELHSIPVNVESTESPVVQIPIDLPVGDHEVVGSVDTEMYTYELRMYWMDNQRQDLVRKHTGTGETTVVHSDIEELSDRDRWKLYLSAMVDDTPYLLFQQVVYDTENGPHPIIRYNVETKEKLTLVHDFLPTDELGFPFGIGQQKISPTGRYIAWIPQLITTTIATEMYVIDTIANTYEKVVMLSGEENLNLGASGLEAGYKFEWTDDETISYDVFDGESNGTYIETRTYGLE